MSRFVDSVVFAVGCGVVVLQGEASVARVGQDEEWTRAGDYHEVPDVEFLTLNQSGLLHVLLNDEALQLFCQVVQVLDLLGLHGGGGGLLFLLGLLVLFTICDFLGTIRANLWLSCRGHLFVIHCGPIGTSSHFLQLFQEDVRGRRRRRWVDGAEGVDVLLYKQILSVCFNVTD